MTPPENRLFELKAHRDEWIKASCSHHIHSNGECIFYFELGFRAFVVFDDAGYPLNMLSY